MRDSWERVAEREMSRRAKTLREGRARVATTAEYTDWLEGYLGKGGKVTDVRSYDTQSNPEFHIFKADADIPALHGATSLSVIIPRRVQVSYQERDHNEFYFMEGFAQKGGTVALYTDVVEEMKKRGTLSKPVADLFDKYIKSKSKADENFFLKMFNDVRARDPARHPGIKASGLKPGFAPA